MCQERDLKGEDCVCIRDRSGVRVLVRCSFGATQPHTPMTHTRVGWCGSFAFRVFALSLLAAAIAVGEALQLRLPRFDRHIRTFPPVRQHRPIDLARSGGMVGRFFCVVVFVSVVKQRYARIYWLEVAGVVRTFCPLLLLLRWATIGTDWQAYRYKPLNDNGVGRMRLCSQRTLTPSSRSIILLHKRTKPSTR